jgi:phosphoribosyl-ATP pyrophosphohydrolase
MKHTINNIEFDAVKWNGKEIDESPVPKWISEALDKMWPEKGCIMRYGEKILISTGSADGGLRANPGDYIIRGANGEIFPCNYNLLPLPVTSLNPISINPDPIFNLNKLQSEFGYKRGEIDPVALLGLFGEAGEVLNEVFLIDNNDDIIKAEDLKMIACEKALELDTLKKKIRTQKDKKISVSIKDHPQAFNTELADCFYYLNILATNQGLTLADLAQISLDKIKAKKEQALG